MYSIKSIGPRMNPWGTPALTAYSWEDFSSRITQSRLLLRKEEIIWNAVRDFNTFFTEYRTFLFI